MALDTAKFMEVQQRARRIMDMDKNGALDKIAKQKGDLLESGEIDFGDSLSSLREKVPSAMEMPIQQNISLPSTSKLPKEILESFKNNQIDTSSMNVGGSVLDAIGVPQVKKQQVKQRIVEETTPVSTQNVSAQVDYSLIKTIVEDCMRKSLSSIKKTILSEGKTLNEGNDLSLIKIGNSFKFVAKNGDIFEAKLNKVGNLNDKK